MDTGGDISQARPSLAHLTDGRLAVAWHEGSPSDCYARIIDVQVSPPFLGDSFLLHPAFSNGDQYRPSVAPLPGGGLVAVWAGAPSYVNFQRFDGAEMTIEGESNVVFLNVWPAVASHPSGEFVIAFGSANSPVNARMPTSRLQH